MRMYWTIASIPELADLPPDRRRRLWRSCSPRAFLHWQVWLAFIIGGLCQAGLLYLGQRITDAWWGAFLAIPLGSLLMASICAPIATEFTRPYLRAARDHTSRIQS